MFKTVEKLKLEKNKAKNKMEFRACNSQGVDRNGAKCNMGFGRISKINRSQLTWCCRVGQRCLKSRSTDRKMQR